MTDIPTGLIWLASYPKSGNTWMRILIANLLSGQDRPADINNLSEPETLAGRWRFADDMLVEPDLLGREELEDLRALHCDFAAQDRKQAFFCKTHDRFWRRPGEPTLGSAARGALYIVRDPRDVAVSLSHHASLSVDAAIAQMTDPSAHSAGPLLLPYVVGDWGAHVTGWTQQRLINTKVVRYEAMHGDTAGTLGDILEFLGGRASEADILRAVNHSRLEELQRQEASKGFRESRPGQKRFFRSGKVGAWREVLSVTQVRLLEDHFGEVMVANGYALA